MKNILIIAVSLVLFIVCACFISGPARNFYKLFFFIFMPEKFIRLSVDDSIAKEKETNAGFKERFDKDADYRKTRYDELLRQFSDSTNELRGNIGKTFTFVFLITLVSFISAIFIKKHVFISPELIILIQIFSSFLILWALLGQMGHSIQTLGGTTLPEQINEYWFRLLNCVGIGLFFFSCFYQSSTGSAEPKWSLRGMGFLAIGAGVILLLTTNIRKFLKDILSPKHKTQRPSLSSDEIMARLEIDDEKVIYEIYEISRKQLSDEAERRSNIDSKASNLAGMIGVYLSLLFGLKGLQANSLFGIEANASFCLYIATCVFAATALLVALLAARTRSDHRTVAESDVFNTEMIGSGILGYKKFMAAHYWLVYRNNYRVNEYKGFHLKTAYILFFLAVICLTVLTASNAIYYKINSGGTMAEKSLISNSDECLCDADAKVKKPSKPSDGDRVTIQK